MIAPSSAPRPGMYRVSAALDRFALALLAGAALATAWVNLAPESYYDVLEWRLLPAALLPGQVAPVTLLWLVGELGMALFVFVIAKELWEAHVLARGALHGPRARLPLAASVGAMAGGVAVWLAGGALSGAWAEAGVGAGWALPVGSDVALCYVMGRLALGRRSPALHLLLLIVIGCDMAALLALGLAGPAGALRPGWLVLPVLAAVAAWVAVGRHATDADEAGRARALRLWPLAVAGVASWLGVVAAGLPGALGLLPVLPAIPHAARSFGLFAEAEGLLHDPLNRLAQRAAGPVTGVLFLFGLTRGGLDLAAFTPLTMVTLLAFWAGKPLGLLAGAALARRWLGAPLPDGVGERDLARIAVLAGMGFTLPLLAAETGLPGGAAAEAARLGLALSLLAGPALLAVTGRRGA